MEVFGVGPAELLLILIVVLVIFGPEQLPEIAKKIGGATREFRRNMDAMSSEMNENLRAFKDLSDLDKLAPAEPPASNLIVVGDQEVAKAGGEAGPREAPAPTASGAEELAPATGEAEIRGDDGGSAPT